MIPQIVTIALAAAADNNICASQAVAGAGALTLNGSAVVGGVAILDYQRHVIVTSAGNDSGITFTVNGTRNDGGVISEVITGANVGIAESTLDFKTVTSVVASAAAAGNVKVGTNGVGASPWQMLSWHMVPFTAGIQINFGAVAANVDIEYTTDDPNGPVGAYPPAPILNPTAFKHTVLQGVTQSSVGSLEVPCWGWRLRVNSGTGSVKATVVQGGMRSS